MKRLFSKLGISASLLLILVLLLSGRVISKSEFNILFSSANAGTFEEKIAVIGGGIAGLTAAYRLKQLGYTNVIVFEKEAVVGGKVSSFEYRDHFYETGAVVVPPSYSTVLGLAEEVGVKLTGYPGSPAYYGRDKHIGVQEHKRINFQKKELLKGLLYMVWLRIRYSEIAQIGFKDISPDLMVPMDMFLEENPTLKALATLYKPTVVAYGYGYYSEIPAIYYLKIMSKAIPNMMAEQPKGGNYFYFPRGYSSLTNALASHVNVQTSTEVTAIERQHSGEIDVTTNKGSSTFDKLIIATNLRDALKYLDVSERERSLFEKVQDYNYYTLVFRANGLPKGTISMSTEVTADSENTLLMFGNTYEENDVYIGYIQASWGTTKEQLMAYFRQGIKAQGGRLEEPLKLSNWRYFPHVSSDVFKSGFYEDLENLQGKNGTYYVGSTFGFELVDSTAAYSLDLINRTF